MNAACLAGVRCLAGAFGCRGHLRGPAGVAALQQNAGRPGKKIPAEAGV